MPDRKRGTPVSSLDDILHEHKMSSTQREQLAHLRAVYGVKTNKEVLRRALQIAYEASKLTQNLAKKLK